MIGLLLLLQSVPPCETPALCRRLDLAAAANRAAMLTAGGYRATIETETATIGRREGRIEGPTLLEQTSSTVEWSNDGGFTQHVTGSRSFPNAIPLSRLALLRIGWVVPTLQGERLLLIARAGAEAVNYEETLRGPLAPEAVVHPLASDRGRFYRFRGGAEVSRRIAGATRMVVAVEVVPVDSVDQEETLFEGEMDLDPGSLAVVRLVGRVRTVGRPARGFMDLTRLLEPGVTLVELANAPRTDGSWTPERQQFEVETSSSRAAGHGAARRVVSRFLDVAPEEGDDEPIAIAAATSGYALSTAPGDSLRRYRRWRTPVGAATAAGVPEFERFRPDRLRAEGRPVVLLQGYRQGDFLRINRVEGLYTGVSLLARMRDAAPGLSFRALAGYGWSEHAVRGGAGAGLERGPWLLEGGGLRVLEVTNKFRNQFDNPDLGGLAGRDPWDYVDRRGVGIIATRQLGDSRGSIVRFDAARVSDHQVTRHMDHSVLGGRLRDVRTVAEGSYWRAAALLDWNPAVSPLFARDGIGFLGEAEMASGGLTYTRLEGRVVVRKNFPRLFLIARLHGGATFGDSPPPQQLFELGGSAGFPGYDYKEFAGNRAALLRIRLSYPLALFDRPFRVGAGLLLPSLAPTISLGFQAGIASASGAGAAGAVRALGDKRNDQTGALVLDPGTGLPLPASVPTGGIRTSIDIRIGVFGDALAVGFARALERGRKARFLFAFGRQF